MKYHVLISCRRMWGEIEKYKSKLEEMKISYEIPTKMNQHLSEKELLPIIGKFDGILAGDDEITSSVIKEAKKLKVVSKWGAGVDNIDGRALEERGIQLFRTPGMLGVSVAEATMGYYMMLARRLHEIHQKVNDGEWFQPTGFELRGKTLGIIGMGNIGQAVAKRAAAFDMKILGFDPEPLPTSFLSENFSMVSMERLLSESDMISLHCPLVKETRHLVNEKSISKMKNGAWIVNMGRGELIDEEALVKALQTEKIRGAALDVFQSEPLPLEHPLRGCKNVIFGSHNGSNTYEAISSVNKIAFENLMRGLNHAEA